MYFFALTTTQKSVLRYHLKLSKEEAHLVESVLGRLVYRHSQADNPKQKAYSSINIMTLSRL
jgi:hypothetical protein